MNASTSGVGPDAGAGLGEPRPGRVAVRHRPDVASIGFVNGKPAGSASPLTWAQAQQARLILALGAGRPLEQPSIVRDRYVGRGRRGRCR